MRPTMPRISLLAFALAAVTVIQSAMGGQYDDQVPSRTNLVLGVGYDSVTGEAKPVSCIKSAGIDPDNSVDLGIREQPLTISNVKRSEDMREALHLSASAS